MRIIHLMLIGILISLAAATGTKSEQTKDASKKVTAPADSTKVVPGGGSAGGGRSTKALKSSQPGENRGKRTLYDYANTGFLYPQIASRRGGYNQDAYYGENTVAQFPSQYNYNYSPYPQYLEAPEPIIEIIIKDANETLGSANPQPIATKTKKKKEKVHVFYVNYKKDENNKLHLESPIASLNNDEADEEEEEEEAIEYPVTPLPPVQSTTLRTIIHPDSEKFQSNSGIHVTFGSEDKSQKGHILEEHNAESVQRHVVAVPVPESGIKTQYSVDSRQDFQGNARSPFASNFFQTSSNLQYQPAQQLPHQHSTSHFRPPVQHQQQFASNSQNSYQNTASAPKTAFTSATAQSQFHHSQQQQPQYQQQQQQQVRKPLAQVQQHIQQQLQHQSQYYVNHNQVYHQPQQHQQQQPQQQQHQQQQPQQQHHQQQHYQQQQQHQQNSQYYNGLQQKPSQSPKQQPIIFPTAPPKLQELPLRQAPQPYQPIKFRPTAAPAATQAKPTPISAKLENYHSKPYQFQRQPQFVQQPTFSVQSPTVPAPQHYKQQQQQQQSHQTQSTNFQSNSIYYTQHRGQLQQQQQGQQATHPSVGTSAAGLNWLDIKPSRETELLKSIPKFEQHITETVQNNYQTGQYQTKNQVIHDIPAPNLAPQTQQSFHTNSNSFSNQNQPQQQFSSFVTTSSNLGPFHHVESSTQAPQFVESTDGQKIMVVTPMPPNVYQQYQSSHFPTSEGNQQQSAQIVSSVQSQDQSKNYFYQQQQPRQGAASIQAQSQPQQAPSSGNSQFSVSNYHSDVFKELGQRKSQEAHQTGSSYTAPKESNNASPTASSAADVKSTTPPPANPKTLLQLPDEVPDELRQQLLSSGILSNADISVLDYDKVGDIALENLPAEHLQHFYGAGGGAQISASKKVLTVVKPNGDKVALDEKELEHVKETTHIQLNKHKDTKVVRFEGHQSDSSESASKVTSGERQYNRYLPLKINAANFPKPDIEDLRGKTIQSVVVLAPVETSASADGSIVEDPKEVKFLGGDLIKVLAKKPTKDNFKRWLEKEARAEVDRQSVVLLVARLSHSSEQEIFMYDLNTGDVNKLNGELSSKFVSVAEENASTEDLEHGSTLDPNFLDSMIRKAVR